MRTEWSWQDPKAASLTCLTLSWVRQHDNDKSDETMCRKLAGPAMHVSFFTIYLCEFTTPIHPLGVLQLAKCNQSYIQPCLQVMAPRKGHRRWDVKQITTSWCQQLQKFGKLGVVIGDVSDISVQCLSGEPSENEIE